MTKGTLVRGWVTTRRAALALANTGWTDEARAASLATRRAKAAERKGQKPVGGDQKAEGGKPPSPSPRLDDAARRKAADADLAAAKRQARKDVEKRRRAKERERMFDQQRERAGRDFVNNWYPDGHDGATEDPHYGVSTREAPYGYVEGTDRPRSEPLYDTYGRPIVPRPREDYHPPWNPFRGVIGKDETMERDLAWIDKKDKAEKEWGPFGRKKQFMARNPGATEADWEKHDKEQFEQWKKEHPR
jgi:hypothetical protein